jgi:hypothetical protein
VGTDIRIFAEEIFGNQVYCAAQFRPVRNYRLFDALGGDRFDDTDSSSEQAGLRYPARGLPEVVSLECASTYFDLVLDEPNPISEQWPGRVVSVPHENTERRLLSWGHWWPSYPQTLEVSQRPDLRLASWLRPDEFLLAIEESGEELPPIWKAFGNFVKAVQNENVRFTFFFDF